MLMEDYREVQTQLISRQKHSECCDSIATDDECPTIVNHTEFIKNILSLI